jgi:hypothetical protein
MIVYLEFWGSSENAQLIKDETQKNEENIEKIEQKSQNRKQSTQSSKQNTQTLKGSTSAKEEVFSFISENKDNFCRINDKFRGMEDGNISKNEKWLFSQCKESLGLSNWSKITNIYYGNEVFMVTTSKGEVYISKDIKNKKEDYQWEKAPYKLNNKSEVINDILGGFLIIKDKRLYISKDGLNKKEVLGVFDYISPDSEIIFFKDKIISFSYEYKNDESKIYKDCMVMKYRIEDKYVGGVINDGNTLIALSLANKKARILNSFDGITWKTAKNKLLYDTNFDGAYGELSLVPEKTWMKKIRYESGGCMMKTHYYLYEIKDKEVIFTRTS